MIDLLGAAGAIDVGTILNSFNDDEIFWAHIWAQEHQARRAEESGKKLGRKIETYTNIMDLKGLSSAHRKCMRFTQLITQTDQCVVALLAAAFLLGASCFMGLDGMLCFGVQEVLPGAHGQAVHHQRPLVRVACASRPLLDLQRSSPDVFP